MRVEAQSAFLIFSRVEIRARGRTTFLLWRPGLSEVQDECKEHQAGWTNHHTAQTLDENTRRLRRAAERPHSLEGRGRLEDEYSSSATGWTEHHMNKQTNTTNYCTQSRQTQKSRLTTPTGRLARRGCRQSEGP
jgi:hypothetical protein